MGKGRKSARKPASGKKSRKRSGSRWVLLLLFLVAGGVVFWQRGEFLTGIQAYLGGGRNVREIMDVSDLADLGILSSAAVVTVKGIPDYESRLRVSAGEGMMTCFRMTGFEDRLFVCTERGLDTPEEIEDIIRKRTFAGRMVSLEKSRLEETLRKGFDRTHKISPARDASLVLVGDSYFPSELKTVLLACCALASILSFFCLILSL